MNYRHQVTTPDVRWRPQRPEPPATGVYSHLNAQFVTKHATVYRKTRASYPSPSMLSTTA
jgi:hypothetical protein